MAKSSAVIPNYCYLSCSIQSLPPPKTANFMMYCIVMTRSFKEVYDISAKEKVNMRTAAYILAIGRAAEAKRLRVIFP